MKLIRNELDFNLSYDYFISILKDTNYISNAVIATVDFTKGNFFTLLPDSADLKKIYEFSYGGILPQNPIQCGPIGSLPGIYQYTEIPTITDEIAGLIIEFLKINHGNLCVMDDVVRSSSDSFQNDFNLSACAKFYNQEVYYFVGCLNCSHSLVVKCLHYSRAFWHSLCILSRESAQDIRDKILIDSKLKSICLNAQFLIVGAYDGEG